MKDGWDFQLQHLSEGRVRNAPLRYLVGRIRWRAVQTSGVPREESFGYYTEAPTAQRYHPVASNRERCCWVELRWSTRDPVDHYWITVRPASDDLNCNIPNSERLPLDQQGPEDDYDPAVIEQRRAELQATEEAQRQQHTVIQSPSVGIARPQTPAAPSETSTEEREAPTDKGEEPEPIQVHVPEVDALAARAELLHLPHDELMAMQTQTQVREEPPYIRINPMTGHAMNVDENTAENIHQALGSDHADPPNEHPHMAILRWQFQVPGNASRQPFHPPPQPPPRRPVEGRGGGGGGGDGRGGGLPVPAGPGLFPPHGRAPDTNKFLGSEPEAFTGDRTKVESFLTQWELYCEVNANNAAIQNQYQKTMLFLTYIKGDLVRTWVLAASCWLGPEVSLYHVDQYDPYLWESIEGAFCRQFADTLEKERAQTKLQQGIRMKDGQIDKYVAMFDTLVAQAGYKADDAQTLEKFISGLPASLYETIYQLDDPKTYKDWRCAAIKQQEKWLHMQSIKQGRRTLETFKQASGSRSNNLNRFLAPPPRDPNAMDTLARTRVQGHLSLTDDPPEYKEDAKPPFRLWERYYRAQQERRGGGNLIKVKCYNCDKMGHFARDCRAPR
jgi:hypothetical protein